MTMFWLLDTNILIAASKAYPLVSDNLREFSRVQGLRLENWLR